MFELDGQDEKADDRSGLTDLIRLSDITPKSRLMVTPTPPTRLSLQCITPLHQFIPTIPLSNDSYRRDHSLSSH
jgi:hypothetical protein